MPVIHQQVKLPLRYLLVITTVVKSLDNQFGELIQIISWGYEYSIYKNTFNQERNFLKSLPKEFVPMSSTSYS